MFVKSPTRYEDGRKMLITKCLRPFLQKSTGTKSGQLLTPPFHGKKHRKEKKICLSLL